MKKKYKILLIVLLVVAAAAFIAYRVLTRDIPPIDDSDLQIVYEDIPSDENALTYFDKAALMFEGDTDAERFEDQLRTGPHDPEFSQEFIDSHQEAVDTFKRGLECSRSQWPPVTGPFLGTDLVHRIRMLARILSVRAMHLQEQGREDEALEAAIEIVRFGHLVEDSRGPYIYYSTYSAIGQIGISQVREIVSKSALPKASLVSCIDKLEHLKPTEESISHTLKADYLLTCKTLELCERHKPIGLFQRLRYEYTYKPNETKRLYAETYRRFLNSISKPWAEVAALRRDTDYEDIDLTKINYAYRPNEIGKLLHDSQAPLLRYLLIQHFRQKIALSMTQVLIALRCYSIDHGELPESFEQLVPQYIDTVPSDDFDGKPLRYSKEHKLIWSIGPDMKDSGGKREWDSKNEELVHDDIAYEITF